MDRESVPLLNRLVSKNVLNMKQKESIDSKSTSHRKVELLLEMLKRCSTNSFNEYKRTITSLHQSNPSHDVELQIDPFVDLASSCVDGIFSDFNNFTIGAFEGLHESNPSHAAGVSEEVEDESESPPLKRKKKEKKVIVVDCYADDDEDKIFEFNLHRPNEISKLQPVPTEMESTSVAVSFDDKLFVIGIREEEDEIWKFERISGWKKCANLEHGRWGHCANIVHTLIYICGGWHSSSNKMLKSVEAFDLQTNKCSTVGELVHAVASSASVEYKGLIYIFGGCLDGGDTATDCVQIFNPRDNRCSVFSKTMPSPQYDLRALTWKNSVILLNDETCFIFDFETENWTEREQFKTNVNEFGLVHDEEKVYVFGGRTLNDKCTDEIKCVRLDDIINGTFVEWKQHGRLHQPIVVGRHAYA